MGTSPYAHVCCDVFGTLIDIASIADELEEFFPTHGDRISRQWRTRQIDYTRLRGMFGQYAHFERITRDSLIATLNSLGLAHAPEEIDAIIDLYQRCPPYPDVTETLATLTQNAISWSVVTNGNTEFVSPILQHADISIEKSNLTASDHISAFKVSPAIYESAYLQARKLNTQITRKDQIFFVSANQWDAIAATWFGFTACWINRDHQSVEELEATPAFEVQSFAQAAAIALPSSALGAS